MSGVASRLERLLVGSSAPGARSVWRPAPAIAATVGILAVSLVVGDLLAFLFLRTYGGARDGTAAMGLLVFPQAIAVLATLALARLRQPLSETLPIGPPVAGVGSVVLSFSVLAAALTVVAALLQRIGEYDVFGDLRPFVALARSDPVWPLMLAAAIGAPLAEELVFRGFLLPALARSHVLGFTGAAVVSSLAWSALHFTYSWTGLAAVFAIGIYLSIVLWRTGSIWTCIACHSLYNFSLLLAIRYIDLPPA